MTTKVLEDVRILFPNFEGRGDKYNAAGRRSFNVDLIDRDDLAAELLEAGYNVREKLDEETGELVRRTLKINLNFDSRFPPRIVQVKDVDGEQRRIYWNEEMTTHLDFVQFDHVDIEISPYDWETQFGSGTSAYLNVMYFSLVETALDRKYAYLDEQEHHNVFDENEDGEF